MAYELDLIIDETDLDVELELDDNIKIVKGPNEVKPLTAKKNGVYDENGVAYSPVTVDVPPLPLGPLNVTENGTYEPKKGEGFNSVNVDVQFPVKPLTVTENGTYEGGMEDGKPVSFNPVTVEVPLPVEPLTVTENGVYEAEQGKGFTPVNVDVKFDKSKVVKEIIAVKNGEAAFLFNGQNRNMVCNLTDETIAEFIKYDTFGDTVSLQHAFAGNNKITFVPLSDTSKVKNWSATFYGCLNLKTIPQFDMSSAINIDSMCCGCGLTEVPLLDVSKITDMSYSFMNCKRLEEFPAWDLRSCVGGVNIFLDMPKCEAFWVKNIITSIDFHYSYRLTQENLIHLIYEYRDTGALLTLTIGSANREKLKNVYVRLIDITDEMRAQDDLIDEKLPFEVCESTDEGAIWIEEYAIFKNLEIK